MLACAYVTSHTNFFPSRVNTSQIDNASNGIRVVLLSIYFHALSTAGTIESMVKRPQMNFVGRLGVALCAVFLRLAYD
jgi:hypothetical protein